MFQTFTIILANPQFSKNTLLDIENYHKHREILGQILDPEHPYQGKIDPDRISHSIKNIKYNQLINELTAEIECLPTVYGLHLYKVWQNNPDKIVLHPVYAHDRLVTINIEIKNNEEI